jgi:hypothetical protein
VKVLDVHGDPVNSTSEASLHQIYHAIQDMEARMGTPHPDVFHGHDGFCKPPRKCYEYVVRPKPEDQDLMTSTWGALIAVENRKIVAEVDKHPPPKNNRYPVGKSGNYPESTIGNMLSF